MPRKAVKPQVSAVCRYKSVEITWHTVRVAYIHVFFFGQPSVAIKSLDAIRHALMRTFPHGLVENNERPRGGTPAHAANLAPVFS